MWLKSKGTGAIKYYICTNLRKEIYRLQYKTLSIPVDLCYIFYTGKTSTLCILLSICKKSLPLMIPITYSQILFPSDSIRHFQLNKN